MGKFGTVKNAFQLVVLPNSFAYLNHTVVGFGWRAIRRRRFYLWSCHQHQSKQRDKDFHLDKRKREKGRERDNWEKI